MRRLAYTVMLAGVTALAPATAAVAQESCDSYSGECVDPGGETIDGGTKVRGTKRTLPFTGGEVALLTVAGVGAVAGGSTLVAASRRRTRRMA